MPSKNVQDQVAAPIVSLYNQSDEEHRLEHDLGPLEETRMHELLKRYLPPSPADLCDVGGAAGAYSFWLAEKGYSVSLIDVVPKHIEQAKQRQIQSPEARLHSMIVGDARMLPFSADRFDCVLMHGPLYHLVDPADRQEALAEALRVLRPNGVLIAVGITRYASLIYGLTAGSIWDPECLDMLVEGVRSGLHRNGFGFKKERALDVYFHLPSELKDEITKAGFRAMKCLGVLGPAWLAQDFDSSWKDPAKRQAILRVARMTEGQPVLGPRTMVVASKPAP
jgi:SAM-dependent methyltransferase